jgi:hypothetical protein
MDRDGVEDDDLTQVRATLALLRARHEAVATEVAILQAHAAPDQLTLARLKKRKLLLKDQIVQLENLLTPDLIA